MSSVIPLHQNVGSGEKDAQVKIMMWHLLMALRGVYYLTGIKDDPVSLKTLAIVKVPSPTNVFHNFSLTPFQHTFVLIRTQQLNSGHKTIPFNEEMKGVTRSGFKFSLYCQLVVFLYLHHSPQ